MGLALLPEVTYHLRSEIPAHQLETPVLCSEAAAGEDQCRCANQIASPAIPACPARCQRSLEQCRNLRSRVPEREWQRYATECRNLHSILRTRKEPPRPGSMSVLRPRHLQK